MTTDLQLIDNGSYRCCLKHKQQLLDWVTYHLFVPGSLLKYNIKVAVKMVIYVLYS